jgi:hypothetical protein
MDIPTNGLDRDFSETKKNVLGAGDSIHKLLNKLERYITQGWTGLPGTNTPAYRVLL